MKESTKEKSSGQDTAEPGGVEQLRRSLEREKAERRRAEAALREAEAAYRTLVDHSPDLIYRLNSRGELVWVNRGGLSVLGYDSAEGLLGRAFVRYIHEEDRERILSSFVEAVAARREFTKGLIFRLVKKDGTPISVELHSRAIFDREGQFCEEVGVVRDISDRISADTERLRREKLESALSMAGAVCHEMNQPLQIISGLTELLLLSVSGTESLAAKLQTIRQQVDRMRETTKKLMLLKNVETREYAGMGKIVDIHRGSGEPSGR
jgi:PAS domain S-box-containing protein